MLKKLFLFFAIFMASVLVQWHRTVLVTILVN